MSRDAGPRPATGGRDRRSDLARIAEDAEGYRRPFPSEERLVADDVLLIDRDIAPAYWYHSVSRVRFSPQDADGRIEDVRRWFRARGRTAWSWSLGPSARPDDIRERLRRTGAVPEPAGGGYTVMTLEHRPPPADVRVEIRSVKTFADYLLYVGVQSAGFATTIGEEPPPEEVLERRWRESEAMDDDIVAFLALLDGEPVSAGAMARLAPGPWLLVGGATVPHARGRGLYRALVGARWDEAVVRGSSALVVQAGSMSRPILERLGFETVCRTDVYVDEVAPPSPAH